MLHTMTIIIMLQHVHVQCNLRTKRTLWDLVCTKSVERVNDVEKSEERAHDHCIHGGIEEKVI